MEITFDSTHTENRTCPCGCGSAVVVAWGVAANPAGSKVLFRVARFVHGEEDHVWMAIGTGPWKGESPETCWISVNVWPLPSKLASRITEGSEAPWTASDLVGGEWLTRDDVLAQAGAEEWLFGWTDALLARHPTLAGVVAKATRPA